MPIPMLAVMAALAAASAAAGASQARSANKANTGIASANLAAEQNANASAAFQARQQQREAKLGSTDAAGNRTYFIPGLGWTTELSPEQQALQDASEQEMLRLMLNGGARNERVEARANDFRNDEATMADEFMRELSAARRPDENAIRQMFLARGAEQRNRDADRTGNLVARSMARQGKTNAGSILQDARASSDASSSRQAGVDAALQAYDEAERRFNNDRTQSGQLYDYFRRAATSGTQAPTGYMPQGPTPRSSGVADQAAINIAARAPQMPYRQPDYSLSDTLSGLGNAIGAYYQLQQGDKSRKAISDRWGKNVGEL